MPAARLALLLVHLLHLVALQELLAGRPRLRLLHAVVGEEVLEGIREQLLAVVARRQVVGEGKEGLEGDARGHRVAQLLHLLFRPQALRFPRSGQLARLELDPEALLQR